MAADCLTRLTDFAERMHYPSTELAKILIESKRGSDAEPLHNREAGAIRKTESFIRILAEDGPSPFFVGWCDPDDRSRDLTQQAESELQCRLVAESHAKEGDSFVNDHVAGDEEPIR